MLPPSQTPQKRTRHAQTPLKSQTYDDELSTAVTPSLSRRLFSPAVPTSIGPTPQRDGRVLGLFDLLSATPSRSTGDGARPKSHIDATPSKRRSDGTVIDDIATPSANRFSRTPTSSRNRVLLDEFMGITTPLHKRDSNPQANKTPSSSRSVSKLQFATPAFLRRTTAPLPPVDENGEWKVEPIKLPRKPIVRGLSSVVASLRKLEEEVLDDELDAMREAEMENEPMFAAPRKASLPAAPTEAEHAEARLEPSETVPQQDDTVKDNTARAKDSEQQRPDKPLLLGAFDDENLYDSQGEEQLDRGRPLRVFKKKGQKRTTRRVNMRPARHRRPDGKNDDDGGASDNDDVVPETQFEATKDAHGDSDPLSGASGSEFGGSDFENDNDNDDETKKKTKAKAKATKPTKKGQEKEKEKEKGKEEGIITKSFRKVKATAHANFKRLKLKNHGAKGGPAHNSRFRRKR